MIDEALLAGRQPTTVMRVKDVSHVAAHRYRVDICVPDEADIEPTLRAMVAGAAAVLFVDVLFVFVYASDDLDALLIDGWVARASWASAALDQRWHPIPFGIIDETGLAVERKEAG